MNNGTDHISRGRFGNAYVQAGYGGSLNPASHSEAGYEEELFRGYYSYLCSRKLRLLRFSGAHDLVGIAAYVRYATKTLLSLLGSDAKGEIGETCVLAVHCSQIHEYMISDSSDACILGMAARARLGSGSVLGVAAAEVTGLLNLRIILSLSEWKLLVARRDTLDRLMWACDLVVPVAMNYRIYFAVRPLEWHLGLDGRRRTGPNPGGECLLGVNSALGSAI